MNPEMSTDLFQRKPEEKPSFEQSLFDGNGKKRLPGWVVLLIFTLCLRVVTILGGQLSGADQPRVAGIAREMAITGDYLIPRLNGQNFVEYPDLGYLPTAVFLSMTKKPTDFLAILPIAILGTTTVLLTFLIGKTMAGPRTGLLAGFFLSTMWGFFDLHRRCLVDPTLLFFITLSLYGFAVGYRTPERSARSYALFYLGMAGGFLSKGLIGIVLPAVTAVGFLIVRKDFQAIRKLILSWGILLFLLPILAWGAAVWRLEDPALLKEIVGQSLWRFSSSTADHASRWNFYYYIGPAFMNLLPWVFLPLIFLRRGGKSSRPTVISPTELLSTFALVWFVIVFVGLSASAAKRTLYLAPIYPAFALLGALSWNRVREEFPQVKRRERHGLAGLFILYVLVHFLVLLPSERKGSFGSFFDAVAKERNNSPIYLCEARESLRGAVVFYTGTTVPVLKNDEVLPAEIENPSGRTLIINLSPGNPELIASLQARGFRLLTEKKVGRQSAQLYANGS
jgi:4-amino-4-deoxy-L-arabinose transferase-like glycosyltransferase